MSDTTMDIGSVREFDLKVREGPFKGINAALIEIDSRVNSLEGISIEGDGIDELKGSIKDARQLVLRRIYTHWMDSETARIEKVMGDMGLEDTEPRHWEMS